MTITHDNGEWEGAATELGELYVIRSGLQVSLNRIDELIKQKKWESNKTL